MGLMCTPLTTTDLILVVYFVSCGIGGFLTFPVMDKIGRRKSHYIFSTGHILGQLLIVYVPLFYARMLGFAIMGLMMSKNSLCYTWLFEFMPMKNKPAASTCVNMFDFATAILAGLYFLFISLNW